jgi:hypothetical protein
MSEDFDEVVQFPFKSICRVKYAIQFSPTTTLFTVHWVYSKHFEGHCVASYSKLSMVEDMFLLDLVASNEHWFFNLD